jgi:1-acyl-sn-glycerol-3-phosphate acyltransferase
MTKHPTAPSNAMLVARSLVFNAAFYLNLGLHMTVAIPTFVLPAWIMVQISRSWGATSLWLLRVICGIKVEWHGLEKIPTGAFLVAAKHQSAWETFALLPLFPMPTALVKRELLRIPWFGWHLWKCGMIAVDRSAGRDALAGLIVRTREALANGRQVIIFPEGTRRPPGAEPDYKLGIVQLYAAVGAPCLPIALNSGLFWPRRKLVRYPGTVRVQILDPLPANLPKREFFARLRHDIEAATARLVAEGERDLAA